MEGEPAPTAVHAAVAVHLRGVRKAFAGVVAVDNVDFEVYEGEFCSLLGPSGSGKTTCLRMIAGFEMPTEGRIILHGLDVTDLPPYGRDVNTVFQDYALFPHMSVRQNVEYGLRVRRVEVRERGRRVTEALEMVRLSGLDRRRPGELSGGQRQTLGSKATRKRRSTVNMMPVSNQAVTSRSSTTITAKLAPPGEWNTTSTARLTRRRW